MVVALWSFVALWLVVCGRVLVLVVLFAWLLCGCLGYCGLLVIAWEILSCGGELL